jgi:Mo-dependent nitrogenase C-terminus
MNQFISPRYSSENFDNRISSDHKGDDMANSEFAIGGGMHSHKPSFDFLNPLRQWLDNIPIDDAKLARLFCRLIPAQCPFERDILLFGRKIAHIPPMCKLNPLYDELVGLRFRALCYLVDVCGETL